MTARLQNTDVIVIAKADAYNGRDGSRDMETFKLIKTGITFGALQDAYAKKLPKFAKDHPSQANFVRALIRRGILKIKGQAAVMMPAKSETKVKGAVAAKPAAKPVVVAKPAAKPVVAKAKPKAIAKIKAK